MHRVKPKYEVHVSEELTTLAEIYQTSYKKAKVLIDASQELEDLMGFYCERMTPAPTKRDLSNKSTQPIFKLKYDSDIQGRVLNFKQPKLTSIFQQSKSQIHKKKG